MMLLLPLVIGLTPIPVRAEPVEALPFLADEKSSPSTSSGRTEVGAQTAIDAERAFAADAKTIGQWTAFRKWSTDDAVMFAPQPVNAHEFLKDRKDPAKAIDWWPTASYISCDGKLAVNTGGWKRPDGNVGYFSTVWQRQSDGSWKWIVDGGGELKKARERPTQPAVRTASCGSPQNGVGDDLAAIAGVKGHDFGFSPDRTLFWYFSVAPDGKRKFSVSLYNGKKSGRQLVTVLDDNVPAPK